MLKKFFVLTVLVLILGEMSSAFAQTRPIGRYHCQGNVQDSGHSGQEVSLKNLTLRFDLSTMNLIELTLNGSNIMPRDGTWLRWSPFLIDWFGREYSYSSHSGSGTILHFMRFRAADQSLLEFHRYGTVRVETPPGQYLNCKKEA